MKSKLLTSLAAALSLHFASCAAGPNTQAGALTGAALGGVAGAIIGNNVGDGDAGTGALIGAAVGGAAGAAAVAATRHPCSLAAAPGAACGERTGDQSAFVLLAVKCVRVYEHRGGVAALSRSEPATGGAPSPKLATFTFGVL